MLGDVTILALEDGSVENPSLFGLNHRRTGLFWTPDILGVAVDGKAAFHIGKDGVGIGSLPHPNVQLYLADDTGLLDPCFMRTAYNGVGQAPSFHLQKSRGTLASPQIVQQGDLCGRIICDAYDGVQWDDVAAMRFEIDDIPGPLGVSGRILLQTAPKDSFDLLEAMRIDSKQRTLFSVTAAPRSNGLATLGYGAVGWKGLYLDYTNTATVGDVTINKPSGRVILAAGTSSVVVTNNRVTAASKILAMLAANDATALGIKSVVPAAGSFTITTNGTATADTAIDWVLINAD